MLKASGKAQDAEKVRRQATEFYEMQAANPKLPEYQPELGELCIQFGEWDKAIAAYTKVIELKPDDPDAWYKRGWVYGNLRQWGKAVDDYSRAIRPNADSWEVWFGRGVAHGGLQKWDKSIEDHNGVRFSH